MDGTTIRGSPRQGRSCFNLAGAAALGIVVRLAGESACPTTNALGARLLEPCEGRCRVRRAVIMADGKRVTANDLELTDTLSALPPQTLKEARESVEREMVRDALRRHKGKITSAALELGISRPTLYELMEKLGIVRDA